MRTILPLLLVILATVPFHARAEDAHPIRLPDYGMRVGGAVGPLAIFSKGEIVEIFDARDNSLSTTARLSVARRRESFGAAAVGNSVIFAGGRLTLDNTETDVVDIFNASTGVWTTSKLPTPRSWITAVTLGQKAFFAAPSAPAVDVFDAASQAWTTVSLPPVTRGFGIAAASDTLFLAGGCSSYLSCTDALHIKNLSSGEWTEARLSAPRGGVTGVSAGTKVFLAGGGTSDQASGWVSDVVDIYDFANGQWIQRKLSRARTRIATVAAGGRVFFAGGCVFSQGGTDIPVDTVDIYDLETDTWEVTRLLAPREGAVAMAIGDYVLFAGGWNMLSPESAATIDFYNLKTRTWTQHPDACPEDPAKIDPGGCGCGTVDIDSDSDGVLDCLDECPGDPKKSKAAACGCGEVEVDSDTDGTPDCVDPCPYDKTGGGDANGDGIVDCVQYGVTINNGALYTNDRLVTLSLNYPSTAGQLMVANDGGFAGAAAVQPASSISWTLSSDGGERLPRTIYVRVFGPGMAPQTYSDDIILDEAAPQIERVRAEGGVLRAGDNGGTTRKRRVRLIVRARDDNSGVAKMQVKEGKTMLGDWENYKPAKRVFAVPRKLAVRVQDRAGNISLWKRAISRQ